MLTLIAKQDMTSYVPYESINISQAAGDPQGKATFQVIDPGSTFSLSSLQEVIFIDETATLGGVTLQPTHNYLNNNNFNFAASGWTESGALTGRITFPSSGTYGGGAVATLTFSNQAVGTDSRYQTQSNTNLSPTNYAIPGQQYCFSATINVTASFTNSYAFLQIIFLDSSGSTLSTTTSSHITSSSGAQIFSVQATAPANTSQIRAIFGGTTTNATNSGTATFTALMLEPMWFPALYSYPSPICDFLQANCITLGADGTTSRLDRVFAGYISHIAVSYEGTTRIWDIETTSVDGFLENVALVNATYNAVTDQSVITGLINVASVPLLFANTPSVATGTPQALAYRNLPVVYAGVTVADLEFADATLREVFNSLSGLTGFFFGVDPYYNVFYYPPFYNEAPYGFAGNGTQPDNVSTFAYYDYSIEYDASQIQNTINVSGTIYELTITEAWHAQDGSHVEILTSGKTQGAILFHLPLTMPSSLVVGGSSLTCTLNTNNSFGTSQSIIDLNYGFIALATAVTAGTSISVTYLYNALVYIQAQSPDSIAQFGRPLYSKINDTNLVSNAQATTVGEAQLQTYAQPRVTLKFKTTKMLQPGQTIEFTSTLDGITKAHYTIQKVTATYLGDGVNQYDVEAGVYVDDFVDFFRNSQKAINRADHDPKEPIKTYNNLQMDSASYTDSLNIHT